LNSHLLIIRPKCGYPSTRFLFYLLQTERFERYILEEQSGTTFQGLSQASVANFEAALPKSFEDQLSIAKFLDSATSAIDTLIEKKQRLIDLLDERRAELISRAVMQGLDPDTPMKDSGIQWLRRPVPAHWELRRVKDCCIAVVDCKNRTPPSVEGGENAEREGRTTGPGCCDNHRQSELHRMDQTWRSQAGRHILYSGSARR
jgi:restriction endonuclease S subunit